MGQGVRVLSENELLAEQGQRVHTGQSDPLNRQFAEDLRAFRRAGGEVSGLQRTAKHLRPGNGRGADSTERTCRSAWLASRRYLSSGDKLRLPQRPVPRQVETVINHRVINRRHDRGRRQRRRDGCAGDVLAAAKGYDDDGELAKDRQAAPAEIAAGTWWWDAE